ncbi:PEP-CTERM protein-sorting domain-containing protein [Evansella caseinilytica]|uniref:PEP-CTERM protein-sorting domain-containing protein n=1 Tax=Evansella caseinilytica TaxID=1503961 RepID=A0A1H3NSR1_9BACI|nr:hypothetical protein [Evansella caseinilytica]SDY91730.1 PEP-CTERM protein-sorting domain-containing protein [Evansella caseinilytica]
MNLHKRVPVILAGAMVGLMFIYFKSGNFPFESLLGFLFGGVIVIAVGFLVSSRKRS